MAEERDSVENQFVEDHDAVTAAAGDAGASGADEPQSPAGLLVEHVADAPDRSLQVVADAAAARQQKIRLRMSLQLWNPVTQQYVGWRGQIWKIDVSDVDTARRAQQLIETVFDMVAAKGIDATLREMDEAKRRVLEQE